MSINFWPYSVCPLSYFCPNFVLMYSLSGIDSMACRVLAMQGVLGLLIFSRGKAWRTSWWKHSPSLWESPPITEKSVSSGLILIFFPALHRNFNRAKCSCNSLECVASVVKSLVAFQELLINVVWFSGSWYCSVIYRMRYLKECLEKTKIPSTAYILQLGLFLPRTICFPFDTVYFMALKKSVVLFV